MQKTSSFLKKNFIEHEIYGSTGELFICEHYMDHIIEQFALEYIHFSVLV